MKTFILVCLLSFLITGCGSVSVSQQSPANSKATSNSSDNHSDQEVSRQMSEQDRVLMLNKVKSSFITKYNLDSSSVVDPLSYDINNDGQDEFIVYNENSIMSNASKLVIAVYNENNAEQIATKEIDAQGSATEVIKLNNKMYGHGLAAILYGNGGYLADVITLKQNDFQIIGEIESQFVDEDSVVADVDGDGYEEFKGLEYASGPGSDNVPRGAGFTDNVLFKWSDTDEKYESVLYGEDGLTNKERQAASTLTEDKAREILKAAYDVQIAWVNPKTEEDFRAEFRPFFTNNFLYSFEEEGIDRENDQLTPLYNISDDTTWLLPQYTNEPVKFIVSDEEGTASIVQNIEVNLEGEAYLEQVETSFVKTDYGWKIENFNYNESE